MTNFIIIIGIGAVIALALSYHERRKRRLYIANREKVDLHKVYKESFFENEIDYAEFSDLWHEVSNILHIDAHKMRPSDRLSEYSTRSKLALFSDLDIFEHKLTSEKDYTIKEIIIELMKNSAGSKVSE